MRISISLNEVIRDFLGQLIHTYEKYKGGDIKLKESDITSFELNTFFKFESNHDLIKFMYFEAPLEIFGHADILPGLMNQLNFFLETMREAGHEVTFVSREVDKSVSATYFFLSKIACRIENVHFVKDSKNEWDGADLLVTANPDALKTKPHGKISVKIKAPYNSKSTADYELDAILELIKDEALRNKIFNTKIITYEEI